MTVSFATSKWFVCAMVGCLLAGVCAAVEFAGGTGEPGDPYQIATAEQLCSIGSDPNLLDKCFLLINDIDLDPNLPGGRVFDESVIAADPEYCFSSEACPAFTGVFNGDGHVIRNLTINIPKIDSFGGCGLFGCVGRGGRVEALRLESVDINAHYLVGALAAENQGTVVQCHATGSVRGRNYVGGLVGRNRVFSSGTYASAYELPSSFAVDGLIFACSVDVDVCRRTDPNVGWTTSTWLGGLVGANEGGVICLCRSAGTVSGQECVGGLVGFNEKGWIHSCYATSSVRGGWDSTGGAIGKNYGSILFCYAAGSVGMDGTYTPGGISGSGSISSSTYLCYWDSQTTGCAYGHGGRAKSTSQMKNRETFRGWGHDGQWVLADGQDYPRLAWEGTPGEPIVDDPLPYIGGAGTVEEPYEIWTVEQLLALGYSWPLFAQHFVLKADVDLSAVDAEEATSIGAPVVPFSGSFDGNGHIVTGFRLWSRMENHVGVFGHIGASGVVKNVVLRDTDICGALYVGALAGSNEGTIMDCSTSGCVHGGTIVGGIVGLNSGIVVACRAAGESIGIETAGLVGYNDGTIDRSHSVVDVVSTNGYAGGFVVRNSGTISASSSDSTVVGARRAGGFALCCYGKMSEICDCYCVGSVEGTVGAAGFVYTSTPTVWRCYSTCVVRSDGTAGGFTGVEDPYSDWHTASVEDCYWDKEASGIDVSDAGTGMNTEEMKQQASFTGWDFENTWMICEGVDYPRLQWEGIECDE
ncbi:MAG: GLUG motif-containing protein [Phycisphaerales bacterium]